MVEIFDNIRKIYGFSAPCPELEDYIEFFSESSFEETRRFAGNKPFTVKMFPSWTPTMWINLGTPYQLVAGDSCYTIGTSNDVLLLRDVIVERINLPSDYIFSVKFFPGGLEAVLGIDQTKFISKIVALNEVLPATLIHQIKTAASFEQ